LGGRLNATMPLVRLSVGPSLDCDVRQKEQFQQRQLIKRAGGALGREDGLFDGVESHGFEPVEVLHSPLATPIRYWRAGRRSGHRSGVAANYSAITKA
jgi:hypothetical protein